MTQINTWAMTGNVEAFRQGATAFRNARDWAKEKRDEFIDAANVRRANLDRAAAAAVDSSSNLVSSFASEASQDELCTTESTSHDSRTTPNKNSNTTAYPEESETSMDELAMDFRPPVKRPNRRSGRSHQSWQNRCGRRSHGSAILSATQSFPVSDVTPGTTPLL